MLLFKDTHIDWTVEKLDELLKLKGIAEIVDGPVFRLILTFGNNNYSKHIPDNYKKEFQEAMDKVVEGNNKLAVDEAFDILKLLVLEINVDASYKKLIESFLNTIEAVLVGLIKEEI